MMLSRELYTLYASHLYLWLVWFIKSFSSSWSHMIICMHIDYIFSIWWSWMAFWNAKWENMCRTYLEYSWSLHHKPIYVHKTSPPFWSQINAYETRYEICKEAIWQWDIGFTFSIEPFCKIHYHCLNWNYIAKALMFWFIYVYCEAS